MRAAVPGAPGIAPPVDSASAQVEALLLRASSRGVPSNSGGESLPRPGPTPATRRAIAKRAWIPPGGLTRGCISGRPPSLHSSPSPLSIGSGFGVSNTPGRAGAERSSAPRRSGSTHLARSRHTTREMGHSEPRNRSTWDFRAKSRTIRPRASATARRNVPSCRSGEAGRPGTEPEIPFAPAAPWETTGGGILGVSFGPLASRVGTGA